MARRVLLAASGVVAAAALSLFSHARELELTIGDLAGPAFSAQGVRARLSGSGLRALSIEIDTVKVAGRVLRKVTLECTEAELTSARIACPSGVLNATSTGSGQAGLKTPVSFSYSPQRRDLDLELKPGADETWRLSGRLGGDSALEIKVQGAKLDRLAPWLPAGGPAITSGRASGVATLKGSALTVALDVTALAFADKSGLHAGEKIAARIDATAVQQAGAWRWKAGIVWRAGEVFWQPLFLVARQQRIDAEGETGGGATDLRQGQLDFPGLGTVGVTGRWDHAAGVLTLLQARAPQLRVAALYQEILKPLLQETALSELRVDGEAGITVRMDRGDLTSFELDLTNVSFEDSRRRFAVFGLTGRLPWHHIDTTNGEIAIKGAEFLKLPVGAVRAPLRMRGPRVASDAVKIPILDGALALRDFSAGRGEHGWRWRFAGEISPLSMLQLSQALGIPAMHGTLSGVIPEVRYRREVLSMDGALEVRVFDGTIRAENIELLEPFGRAPRLHGDLQFRALDLELLTRAFDFGTITGRIDAAVRGLELVAWQPTRFDARIGSSEGMYPRKISQRAVQNISALGGAGAAAAIQRSLLRFFEQFGYERLGVSCRLENGICEMDGIERAPQGFVIVKGGGIPAISVIGYNRQVSWRELIDRLKRITQDNVKPIVK